MPSAKAPPLKETVPSVAPRLAVAGGGGGCEAQLVSAQTPNVADTTDDGLDDGFLEQCLVDAPVGPAPHDGNRAGVRLFAPHHLAANFAALIGFGMNVRVPLASFQIVHLGIGQGHVPLDGLGGSFPIGTATPAFSPVVAGPWKWAAVAGPVSAV